MVWGPAGHRAVLPVCEAQVARLLQPIQQQVKVNKSAVTLPARQNPLDAVVIERFRAVPDPLGAIGDHLAGIAEEATARGYNFDTSKVHRRSAGPLQLEVTTGQLALEWEHLLGKLSVRSPELAAQWSGIELPEAHPLFAIVDGPVASWERAVPQG